MAQDDILVGSVVILRSGGLPMTVERLFDDNQIPMVTVIWFDQELKPQTANFVLQAVQLLMQ
jgi:uncharacterized protein YodC (DUF2158 family)